MSDGPFALLGLSAADDLTDDEVRAAWRRLATATHPDRADGGDPERFASAAAAYTELRTRSGRGEARAALSSPGQTGTAPGPTASLAERAIRLAGLSRLPGPVSRFGPPRPFAPVRPVRLLVKIAVALIAGVGGVWAAGHGPARPALAVGAATWLAVTTWHDLRRL